MKGTIGIEVRSVLTSFAGAAFVFWWPLFIRPVNTISSSSLEISPSSFSSLLSFSRLFLAAAAASFSAFEVPGFFLILKELRGRTGSGGL